MSADKSADKSTNKSAKKQLSILENVKSACEDMAVPCPYARTCI